MPRYPRVEDDDFDWMPYLSVGDRRQQAQSEAAKLRNASPVIISGSRIANTFWGKSWCENLERYSDYANRLPRGRTYVRSGSVIDLKITAGKVQALVSGSRVWKAGKACLHRYSSTRPEAAARAHVACGAKRA